jgi:hypothetical protein
MANKPFVNFIRKVLPFVAPRVSAVVETVEAAKAAPAPVAAPQVMQGGVTYTGLAIAAVAYVLQQWGLVPPGMDSAAVAAVLVGLAVAVYGRVRREWRA